MGGQRLHDPDDPGGGALTGLFILFMPFHRRLCPGPWLVVLVNALMALPHVLRTSRPPMQLVVRQYDRLAGQPGGARPASPAPGGMAPAAPSAGPGHGALDDIVPQGISGHRHVQQPDPHHLPWLLYQQLGSYRLTEAAATALLLLTLCFSLFWLVERGLGGRHVDH